MVSFRDAILVALVVPQGVFATNSTLPGTNSTHALGTNSTLPGTNSTKTLGTNSTRTPGTNLTQTPGTNLTHGPSPLNINWQALTNGSLGTLPAKMFVLQGIFAQLRVQDKQDGPANRPEPAPTPTPTPDNGKAAKDKAKKDGNNGGIVGNTIGGALIAGLMNAPKGPIQALCSALTIGAGSALGAKVGQETGGWMDDSGKPGENKTRFGKGMVSPFVGNFVGTGACIGLGEAICGNLGMLGAIPKLASTARAVLGDGAPLLLRSLLKGAGATEAGATTFTSQLANTILRLNHFNMADAAAELQTSLVRGAAEAAEALGAGQGAAFQPALTAMSQLGSLPGMAAGVPGMTGTPGVVAGTSVEALHAITGQLKELNDIAASIPSIPQEANKRLKKAVDDLHSAVTQAKDVIDQPGKSLKSLVGVGETVGGFLSGLNPFDDGGDKTKTHHVTKTKKVTETKTKTKTETAHVTDRVQTTQVDHTVKTDHKTVTDRVQTTKVDHTIKTAHKTVTDRVQSTQVVTKTVSTTKEVTKTTVVTATNTKKVSQTAPPAGIQTSASDIYVRKFRNTDGQALAICNSYKEKVHCWGREHDSPIQYNHFESDEDFEKCVRNEQLAKCFDKSFPDYAPVSFWSDNKKKIRGNACAAPHQKGQKIQCWGTPSRNHIKWHHVTEDEEDQLDQCFQNMNNCKEWKWNES